MIVRLRSLALLLLLVLVGCASASADPYEPLRTTDPNKQTMVALFEWSWADVANECETFLSKWGYGAVQISVPTEDIYGSQWWTRYQPISYKLVSRSGNRDELADMIQRCNAAGVRIIVDVVTNHMCGVGSKGQGVAGTSYDGTNWQESFPGVPYSHYDFNDQYCDGDIQQSDYCCNADNVRRCRLSGLLDLNHDTDYVRGEVAAFLSDVMSLGAAGIRMDAAKHMYPNNIAAMLAQTNNLNADQFGSNARPFVVQEVIDYGGESVNGGEYVDNGRITNFKYGKDVTAGVRRQKNFKYFWNFGPAWSYWDSHDVLVFIDDHDTQRDADHDILYYADGQLYQLAVGYMLGWTYGIPRVMSSYYFSSHDQGPPSNRPTFNADGTCDASSGWVCEHRWPATKKMTLWRSKCLNATPVNFYNTTDNCLAWAKQGCGFFALNNDFANWSFTAATTLPAGTYCDIYWSDHDDASSGCDGHSVTVDSNGNAHITVEPQRFLAIYI